MRQIKRKSVKSDTTVLASTQLELKKITEFASILDSELTDEKLWIVGDTDGLLHNPNLGQLKTLLQSYTAVRFGIEDKIGVQDRVLDMQGYALRFKNSSNQELVRISTSDDVPAIALIDKLGTMGLYNPDSIKLKNAILSGEAGQECEVLFPYGGYGTMVMTINGEGADNYGNINIHTGDNSLNGAGYVKMDGQTIAYVAKITLTGGAEVTGILPIANGGTGSVTANPQGSANIGVTGTFPNNIFSFVGKLPLANGGTGTDTPSLVAGANIAITGTWPNQTVTGTGTGLNGTGYVKMLGAVVSYIAQIALSTDVSGILKISNGGTGTATPALINGQNVSITGSWPNQTINISGIIPIANGGTGTATPTLIAGSNVTITGIWPNQTINSSAPLLNGTGYVKQAGTVSSYIASIPLTTDVSGVLAKANGGTGTATPGLVAGNNVTLSGIWPNQTIAASSISTLGITLDGGGFVLTTGQKGYIRVPYNCTIQGYAIISKEVGSIQLDIWKAAGVKPTSSAQSIVASAPPALASTDVNASGSISGWNTVINSGDILAWSVTSVTTITWCVLEITILKN